MRSDTLTASRMGALLACRSESRSAWRTLREPNPLLWFGIASELLLLSALVLVPALGSVFSMKPFPLPVLGWLLLFAATAILFQPLVVIADVIPLVGSILPQTQNRERGWMA